MESSNGPEFGRNRAPKLPARDRSGRSQPPTGFEGMNFEQKRRPYKKTADSGNNAEQENIAHKKDLWNESDKYQA